MIIFTNETNKQTKNDSYDNDYFDLYELLSNKKKKSTHHRDIHE